MLIFHPSSLCFVRLVYYKSLFFQFGGRADILFVVLLSRFSLMDKARAYQTALKQLKEKNDELTKENEDLKKSSEMMEVGIPFLLQAFISAVCPYISLLDEE